MGKEKEISIDSKTGDATLKLNNIVVKDYEAWSRSQASEEEGFIFSSDRALDAVEDKVEIKENVKVTFHRMWSMFDTFPEFYQDFHEINASLDPKFNQQ